jgi:hypothetical protein
MKRKLLSLAAVGMIGFTASVDAAAISVNFVQSANHANQQVDSATLAGLSGYTYANWNNAAFGLGPLTPLANSDGNVTGASVTYSANNAWGDGTANTDANAGVGDARIARGYLDDPGSGVSITLAGHGFAIYDVVVYFSTDNPGTGPYAPVTINGTSVQTTGARSSYGSNPGWDATDTVVLTGQSAATLTLTATRAGSQRASIAGIQIIQANPTLNLMFQFSSLE